MAAPRKPAPVSTGSHQEVSESAGSSRRPRRSDHPQGWVEAPLSGVLVGARKQYRERSRQPPASSACPTALPTNPRWDRVTHRSGLRSGRPIQPFPHLNGSPLLAGSRIYLFTPLTPAQLLSDLPRLAGSRRSVVCGVCALN